MYSQRTSSYNRCIPLVHSLCCSCVTVTLPPFLSQSNLGWFYSKSFTHPYTEHAFQILKQTRIARRIIQSDRELINEPIAINSLVKKGKNTLHKTMNSLVGHPCVCRTYGNFKAEWTSTARFFFFFFFWSCSQQDCKSINYTGFAHVNLGKHSIQLAHPNAL